MEADQTHELPRTSAPASRALAAAGITTLEELSRHSRSEIAQLHGVGPTALETWKAALDASGIDPEW
ncbi:MAG TPA: helix-hairpin-helix domain-containing protein [Arthrobacter sp.]|nr:helix-hairpin-helix domain-containing protein [Arthrobacter sp.]